MHNPTYSNLDHLIEIKFRTNENLSHIIPENRKISDLIKDKYKKRERFYGIEISAKSRIPLDYSAFKIQPLFTSIVWIGTIFADIEPISRIAAVRVASMLRPNGIVLPHLSCYKMTKDKLDDIMREADFNNVLALRGDEVYETQEFKYASELVQEIRKRRNDTISIGVGGYPDVHPEAKSKEEDLTNLKNKVDMGADFIITQLCFSSQRIKEFIKNCRNIGIAVPIIPGIFVPPSWFGLQKMLEITKVPIDSDLLEKFKEYQHDSEKFKEFSSTKFTEIVKDLFESDLEIFGVQFFTFNYFDVTQKVIDEVF